MCLSCELHDKWPPFIEFLIWFILMGINVGNHFAVYIVLQSHVIDLTHPLYRNTSHPNATTPMTPLNLTTPTLTESNYTSVPSNGSLIPLQSLNATPAVPVVAAGKIPSVTVR